MTRAQKWIVVLGVVFAGFVASAVNPVVPRVDTSAFQSAKTTEVLVWKSLDGGYAAMPSSALSGRRAVEIQNNGPNVLKCRAGSGDFVREIAVDSTWSTDVTDAITIQCDVSADQVAGNATAVTEVK